MTALVVGAALAVACADDTSGGQSEPVAVTTSSVPPGAPTSTTTAVARGGTLAIGTLDRGTLLDPLVAPGDGTGRGTEMAAVYDTILRFDPTSGNYQTRLATSLVASADGTTWTLTLRDGVVFSDGTPYDAEAVKFGLDRYRVGRPGVAPCTDLRACGRVNPVAVAALAAVTAITVTGPRTLVLAVDIPGTDVSHALATEPGMIPSPTALRAACPADPVLTAERCPFASAPVGAGPFVVTSVVEGGRVTMARNPRHWAGEPPIEGLRFVPLADEGGTRALDQLTTGSVDIALLLDPRAVATAKEKRFAGRRVLQFAGAVEVLNHDADARPATRFLRVREAIAAAIDPVAVSERVTGVRDPRAGELVPANGRLGPGTPPRGYEPDRARQLVAEARANGWDGTVRYLCDNSARGQARGIAIETMLKAVGITTVVDTTKDRAAVRTQVAAHDFDLACGSIGATVDAETGEMDGTALVSLVRHLSSTGDANTGNWRDPATDQALRVLGSARTDAERRAAARVLAERVSADVPVVVTGVDEQLLAWRPRVRGVVATSGTRLLLGAAWSPSGSGG
jgi:peptide/nickel transport system substrate-binding protein